MATTPVTEITVKNLYLSEMKLALEALDNPNSAQDGKPKPFKFKEAGRTRFDLALNYREVAEHARIVEKARLDIVRLHLDEQLKALPDSERLTGKWNQIAMKEVEELWAIESVLKIRQIQLSNLDIEQNAIPFTAIGILLGTVIKDDTKESEG